ncbi:hypothetical protein BGI41_02395 [Methanobrevibacter sp. 87.7]|nr:hypothetical protein BGI41_02395 [Methanobrevibacter sp. 87.7]
MPNILLNNFNVCIYLLFTVFIIALFTDFIIGELPNNLHVVVLIGKLIDFFKKLLIKYNTYFSGLLVTIFVVIIFLLISEILYRIFIHLPILIFVFVLGLFFSSTFSIKLLLNTAESIRIKLENNEFEQARTEVSYLVSRPTRNLSRSYIISATIESLTENVTDSIISPLFYYFVFGFLIILINYYNNIFDNSFVVNNISLFLFNSGGIPANDLTFHLIFICIMIAFIYRIINTEDAMLGYKTEELRKIGFFPAIFDDILNFIPARIAGVLMVIASKIIGMDSKNAIYILKRDAKKCESPNSGYTMATAAGALGIQLIKKDNYILGDPLKFIEPFDIRRAYNLSRWTIFLFILIQFIILFIILIVL